MNKRLDGRPVLYGEPRLSDAQVRALRHIRDHEAAGGCRLGTLKALRERLLIERAGCGWRLTGQGRDILQSIEETQP